MNKLTENQVRQGDVLIVRRVEENVDAGAPIEQPGSRVVLREGEATGHAHAFYEPDRVKLTETATKERHLRVVETALLRHEEHTHVEIAPGIYDLPTQVEWTDANEPRAVQD